MKYYVKKSRVFKMVIIMSCLFFFLVTPISAARSQERIISTDRGNMRAYATGFYFSSTGQKGVEYWSEMISKLPTRLYLKSTTVQYLTGDHVHTVPRWGWANKTFLNDYFYLNGYRNTELVTYTTHEAIYTNAHTVMLTIRY